ncbi:MAG: hypothetical protein HGA35_02085 [Erysipelotrichaceae bacterium]|nr:hypothetical protein [Erysipelotrichaceae bacterium]
MDDNTRDNVNLKREFNRFINRFFYSKERTLNNLAEIYFLLDDMISYINVEQTKIGNEMLDKGFAKEYLKEKGLKLFLDEELQTILIDKMTDKEKTQLVLDSNKEYIEKQKG